MTRPGPDGPHRNDAGFTMIELLVAMGVFTILLTIMLSATLSSMSSIRSITNRSDTQGSASLAMEQASRLLRYLSKPDAATAAIASASATSITFFTYSGTGTVGAVPYKVSLLTRTIDGRSVVVARTYAPTAYTGNWGTYSASYTEHRLFTAPIGATDPLTIAITQCSVAEGTDCYQTHKGATIAANGTVNLDAGYVPDTVTVSLGDSREPQFVIKQTIALVNSIGKVNWT